MTRLLSNSISYTRILALLMAHWALLLVTYTVAGLVGYASIPALIISGIIIVGGNIFVLGLEGLIVFIHTLRLHFYEWFSKFYEGTGTEFKPFKQNHVYTDIVVNKKKRKIIKVTEFRANLFLTSSGFTAAATSEARSNKIMHFSFFLCHEGKCCTNVENFTNPACFSMLENCFLEGFSSVCYCFFWTLSFNKKLGVMAFEGNF